MQDWGNMQFLQITPQSERRNHSCIEYENYQLMYSALSQIYASGYKRDKARDSDLEY